MGGRGHTGQDESAWRGDAWKLLWVVNKWCRRPASLLRWQRSIFKNVSFVLQLQIDCRVLRSCLWQVKPVMLIQLLPNSTFRSSSCCCKRVYTLQSCAGAHAVKDFKHYQQSLWSIYPEEYFSACNRVSCQIINEGMSNPSGVPPFPVSDPRLSLL